MTARPEARHDHDHGGGGGGERISFPDNHGEESAPVDPALAAAMERDHWKIENVAMVTVGIDIGSSTSHLMFSRVHLQRMAQALSSRFVVVDRQVLWRSPIILTPYVDEDTIDSEALDRFVHDCYRQAGIDPADVDSGAVILTGEALRRRNAQAIAELFADESGTFVCASAGHHLETAMAAHGSGAVRMSREFGKPLLHVDIGGGTSKIALVADGEVLDTAAIAVGGRLLAFDGSGAVARIEAPARTAASARGIALSLGREPPAAELSCVVETMADALAEVLSGKAETELAQALLVTEPPDWPVRPEAISLSGGVAEYIYGRETAGYADIAPALAAAVRARLEDGRVPLPLVPAPQGIRATVIGASQFSLQVSGNTVSISDERVLPKTNIPVLYPRMDLDGNIDAERVAAAIVEAARRMDVAERRGEVALGFAWDGDPEHRRLAALATGIVRSRELVPELGGTLMVLLEGDVARSVGHILRFELGVTAPVLCLDGLQLREFDYVDIGTVIRPSGVVPVVIKSLLFGLTNGREQRVVGAGASPAARSPA